MAARWNGYRTVGFCDNEPYAQAVLKSIGQKCRSTKTSAKYEASYTQESLFSQVDFHANHSQSQANNEARMTTVISGQKCCALYKKQSPLGSLVRMLLGSSTWHSTRCVLTWKVKVTKSNRSLFQLAPLTRHTEETGFGLWATPNSMDSLPPRQAEDCSTNQKNREGRSRSGNLREQVVHPQMWPTPTAGLEKHSTEKAYWENRMNKGRQMDIQMAVYLKEQSGSLNPAWVEWLMGYPIGHTDLKDWVTPSSRKSRQKSSDASTK